VPHVVLTIEYGNRHSAETWDSIVTDSRSGTIFHLRDWLDISMDAKPRIEGTPIMRSAGKMLVLADDREPVGVFAGIEYNVLGLKALISPGPRRLTPYGGLVVRKKQDERIPVFWQALKSKLLREYSIIVVTNPPAAERKDWSQQEIPRKTLVLDLTKPVNILWSGMRKGRRYDIKKAEKSGVLVVEGTTEAQVAAYYDLLKRTLERKEFSVLPPLDFYVNIFRVLWPSKARLLLATHQDEIVAGAFLLNDEKHLYYWSGASQESGLALGANSMIQWKAILWGKENGIQEYDMTGANIPSVAFFKAGFGGEYRQYHTFVVTKPSRLEYLVTHLVPKIQ
jgi:hypothetical protein